jgi:hypothetical protein
MLARQEVGQLPKRVPIVKRCSERWAQSSLNIFGAESEPECTPAKAKQPAGGVSQVGDILRMPEPCENTPSQQPQQGAPVEPTAAPAKPRSSVVLHAPPGGNSSVGALFSGSSTAPEPMPTPALRPAQTSNIFAPAAEAAPLRPSTRVMTAPGGASMAGAIINQQLPPEPYRGVATGRSNQSQNVMSLTPTKEPAGSLRTAKANASVNVVNLSPAPVPRLTARTAKANDECPEEQKPLRGDPSRYAARNKMMQSSVFAGSDAPSATPANGEGQRPCRKIQQAPGGSSSVFP